MAPAIAVSSFTRNLTPHAPVGVASIALVDESPFREHVDLVGYPVDHFFLCGIQVMADSTKKEMKEIIFERFSFLIYCQKV